MKIYDETTGEEVLNPDLNAGYLYSGSRVVGHEDERYEVMEGTVSALCPNGLKRLIPAHDVYEDCQFYHKYTEAEIAKQNEPKIQDRITAIEAQATYTAMMTDTLIMEE